MKMRNEFSRDAARFERDGRALVETLRSSARNAGAREEADRGVRSAPAARCSRAVEDAEARMSDLASQERHLGGAASAGRRARRRRAVAERPGRRARTESRRGSRRLQAAARTSSTTWPSRLRCATTACGRAARISRRFARTSTRFTSPIASPCSCENGIAVDRAALEAFGERMTAYPGTDAAGRSSRSTAFSGSCRGWRRPRKQVGPARSDGRLSSTSS